MYTLIEVRKLLDRQGVDRGDLQRIWFFCDWVAHISLDRKKGWQAELLNFADSMIERKLEFQQLPREEQTFMFNTYSLFAVRDELIDWLRQQGIEPAAIAYLSGWYWFIRKYADVTSDCPLVLKGGKHLKQVTLEIVQGNGSGTRLDMEWTFVKYNDPTPFQIIVPTLFEDDGFYFGARGIQREDAFNAEIKSLGFTIPWQDHPQRP